RKTSSARSNRSPSHTAKPFPQHLRLLSHLKTTSPQAKLIKTPAPPTQAAQSKRLCPSFLLRRLSHPPAILNTPPHQRLTPASATTSTRPFTARKSSTTPLTAFHPIPCNGGYPNPKTKHRFNTSPPSIFVAEATSSFPSPPRSSSTTAHASASAGTASIGGQNSPTRAMRKSSQPRSIPTTPSSSTKICSTTV